MPAPTRLLILTILALLAPAVAMAAEDDAATFNMQAENDLFASDNDRHYTNGVRLSYLTKAKPCPDDRKRCLSGILRQVTSIIPAFRDGEEHRISYSLGQNMYTPSDITVRELLPDDRPYAGWLYAGLGFVSRNTFEGRAARTYNRIDNLEINIGMVGPWSGAEFAQKNWHKLFNFRKPQGWDNQLHNEPGLVLIYERIWLFNKRPEILPHLEMEFAPNIGGAVGNVYTHAAAGLRARIGVNLPDDYGPPRIRPSLPGSDYFSPGERLGFYVSGGIEGRAVARNIFLDGNTFRSSPSVDKKHFVGDLQAGATLVAPRLGVVPPFRLSYTYIWRSKEFHGQDFGDRFGSINLSFNL